MQIDLLFVYGTLISQCRNPYSASVQQRATLLGRAKVRGKLVDLGNYPGLIYAPDSDSYVCGELYQIIPDHLQDLLHFLDRYEGCSDPEKDTDEYFRREVTVHYRGAQRQAFSYVLNEKLIHDYTDIKGGDYLSYLRQHEVRHLTDPRRNNITKLDY